MYISGPAPSRIAGTEDVCLALQNCVLIHPTKRGPSRVMFPRRAGLLKALSIFLVLIFINALVISNLFKIDPATETSTINGIYQAKLTVRQTASQPPTFPAKEHTINSHSTKLAGSIEPLNLPPNKTYTQDKKHLKIADSAIIKVLTPRRYRKGRRRYNGTVRMIQAAQPMGLSDFPRQSQSRALFPNPARPHDDRILEQLLYTPENADNTKVKTILVYGLQSNMKAGQSYFKENQCGMCALQYDVETWASKADAVLFKFHPGPYKWKRPAHQVWVLSTLESPFHTSYVDGFKDQINWTATYRSDSTLVTPYEKFVPYHNKLNKRVANTTNYASGKHKMVAWFVSNCMAKNERTMYASELGRHIEVDIYGGCGTKRCPRSNSSACFDMLRKDYKFYLAFENSNCQHYITEKLFWNALLNDVVPVVMGARKEDYTAVAPPGSFIHVDDYASPAELADYLKLLSRNDSLYNEYFKWKDTGEFIDTRFWCRLCSLLHAQDIAPVWYDDVTKWWRHGTVCTRDRWDDPNDLIMEWKTSTANGA